MPKIQKLPQEVINQIAAGEVVERPASVVKELIDNAIDATADKISIAIKQGGISLIQITDNGQGIEKDSLPLVFQQHTTSKITSLSDLDHLSSMGFRGEALASIASVSKITLRTKTAESDAGLEISNKDRSFDQVKSVAHPQGTTIIVEDLFYNTPTRRKFLKSEQTEYRKILTVVQQYALIHPEITFELKKDGKQVLFLPKIQGLKFATLHPKRAIDLIKHPFLTDPIQLSYEENYIKLAMLLAHPTHNIGKTQYTYIYVNKRPIYDKGIQRSVYEGYSRFIPHGQKIPFILMLDIDPKYVDVNVHPQKHEVRFLNPYRIYSVIESTIQQKLEQVLHKQSSVVQSQDDIAYSRLRQTFNTTDHQTSSKASQSKIPRSYTNQRQPSSQALRDQAEIFTDSLLTEMNIQEPKGSTQSLTNDDINLYSSPIKTTQIFNKYIIAEYPDEIWIIDQHAAAERITFEKLLGNKDVNKVEIQQLITPIDIKLGKVQLELVNNISKLLTDIGFEFVINEDSVSISQVPTDVLKYKQDIAKAFENALAEIEETGVAETLKFNRETIVATIACHTSIRKGQKLPEAEQRHLIKQLLQCKNAYSCPHGRPAIWRLSITDIDKNFYRTY